MAAAISGSMRYARPPPRAGPICRDKHEIANTSTTVAAALLLLNRAVVRLPMYTVVGSNTALAMYCARTTFAFLMPIGLARFIPSRL
ncbi:hypothetical protein CO683_35940 [Bradyrhizobium ottawaense]|nr:hypothetical protein CO683_35940 [Bradyrhizobium ottawaense]